MGLSVQQNGSWSANAGLVNLEGQGEAMCKQREIMWAIQLVGPACAPSVEMQPCVPQLWHHHLAVPMVARPPVLPTAQPVLPTAQPELNQTSVAAPNLNQLHQAKTDYYEW